jgi:outer membrane protein assembly factor BamB
MVVVLGIAAFTFGQSRLAQRGNPGASQRSGQSSAPRPTTAARAQTPAPAFDWSQWRGPDRSGVSKETGLMKQWPASGPQLLGQVANLGNGFGSLAVHGGRVYVQGMRGRESVVTSLDTATGRVLWSRAIGPSRSNDRGPGPRGTPSVDGGRVYVLTENGDLACLRTQDGTVVWHRNILRDFGGRNIGWLISESPLVDGNRVIVTPGGQGATIVSLDKMTGVTQWTSRELSDQAGYSSVVAADIGGVRTYMALTEAAGVGVRASDGKLMWRYTKAANGTANAATPVFGDNKVFYTSAYGTGGGLLNLTPAAGAVQANEAYFTRDMQNHHGGVVLVNGFLYGFNNAILTCMEFATGRVRWRHRSVGKGSLVYADGMLFILSENNVVGLADASPEAYREKGRFEIADQGWPSWAHPVVSNGRLYIRNQGTVASYDIRAR